MLLFYIYKQSYVSVAIRQVTFLGTANLFGPFNCICGYSSRSVLFTFACGDLLKKNVLPVTGLEFYLVADFLASTLHVHSCFVVRSIYIWVHCRYIFIYLKLYSTILPCLQLFNISYWNLKSLLLSNFLSLLRMTQYWPYLNINWWYFFSLCFSKWNCIWGEGTVGMSSCWERVRTWV